MKRTKSKSDDDWYSGKHLRLLLGHLVQNVSLLSENSIVLRDQLCSVCNRPDHVLDLSVLHEEMSAANFEVYQDGLILIVRHCFLKNSADRSFYLLFDNNNAMVLRNRNADFRRLKGKTMSIVFEKDSFSGIEFAKDSKSYRLKPLFYENDRSILDYIEKYYFPYCAISVHPSMGDVSEGIIWVSSIMWGSKDVWLSFGNSTSIEEANHDAWIGLTGILRKINKHWKNKPLETKLKYQQSIGKLLETFRVNSEYLFTKDELKITVFAVDSASLRNRFKEQEPRRDGFREFAKPNIVRIMANEWIANNMK